VGIEKDRAPADDASIRDALVWSFIYFFVPAVLHVMWIYWDVKDIRVNIGLILRDLKNLVLPGSLNRPNDRRRKEETFAIAVPKFDHAISISSIPARTSAPTEC